MERKNLFAKETTSVDSVVLNVLEVLNYVSSIAVFIIVIILSCAYDEDFIFLGILISAAITFIIFTLSKAIIFFFLNVERGLKYLVQFENNYKKINEKTKEQ